MRGGEYMYSYINKNGKRVSGTAATLHEIKETGGLQKYHDKIGRAYIENFVDAHSDIINAGIKATSKRKKFKVVG